MKNTLVGIAIGIATALLVWLLFLRTPLSGPDMLLLDQARERSARLEKIQLTARGESIRGEGWSHSRPEQAQIPESVAEGALKRSDDGSRIGLAIGSGPGSALTEVWMDRASPHEGNLFRVHVDRSGNPVTRTLVDELISSGRLSAEDTTEIRAALGNRLVVIGMYDRLWSREAVEDQAYACWECAGVTVCGSTPRCRR